MTKKIAWIITFVSSFVISLLLVFILVFSFNAYQNSQPLSTVKVNGEAKKEVDYDTATITYSIQTRGLTSEIDSLNQESDTKTNQVIDLLISEGISQDDIITNKNSYADYYFDNNGSNNEENRTVVDSTIEVTYNDVQSDTEKPNSITQKLSEIGVTNFSGYQYSIDNEEEICENLKIEAIKDATKKAEERVEALGGKKIIRKNVSEFVGCGQDFGFFEDYPIAASREIVADESFQPAPVLTGSREISVSIELLAEYR